MRISRLTPEVDMVECHALLAAEEDPMHAVEGVRDERGQAPPVPVLRMQEEKGEPADEEVVRVPDGNSPRNLPR